MLQVRQAKQSCLSISSYVQQCFFVESIWFDEWILSSFLQLKKLFAEILQTKFVMCRKWAKWRY